MARLGLLAVIFVFAFLPLLGCDFFPQQKYLPSNIAAMPFASEAGMMWGGDKAKIMAFILR